MTYNAVNENTDLSKCEIHNMPWDVNIRGVDYIVCRIDGYYHGEGGKFGLNDYYAYPANETPCYENLIPWWSKEAVRWGFKVESCNYLLHKRGDCSVEHSYNITITRNDVDFYNIGCHDMSYGIAKAQTFIAEVQEDVVPVNERDFDKKLIGQRIEYMSKPAIIDNYFWGQHCIWIVADNESKKFDFSNGEKDDEGYWENYVDGIKVDCTSERINWFPKTKGENVNETA